MAVDAHDAEPVYSSAGFNALPAPIMLFEGLQDDALRAVQSQLEWLSLPGGWTLFEEGETADALYIVTSGRLGVFVTDADGGRTLVGQVRAGEVVGEMALITGQPRSATVVGMRDTTLVRFSRSAFEHLVNTHPQSMLQLMRLIVRRLEQAIHQRAETATVLKTFALVPLSRDAPTADVAARLTTALGRIGLKAQSLSADAAHRSTEWFHNVEAENDVVVYQAEASLTPWTRLCLRQADCHLLTARAAGDPSHGFEVEEHLNAARTREWVTRELVLLDDVGTSRPLGTERWLTGRRVAMHHHVRLARAADFDRLARLLTGRAVGLVLSGGAARGSAHFGVIRALREVGIPIDLVGGTSMGAIVAAFVAHDWDYDTMLRIYRKVFVENNPLADYRLPRVALVAGNRVSRFLHEFFGDVRIEDLWRTFFCVSSNLTTRSAAVHSAGPLWRWLRASISLPGILPPVIEHGDVFVDGGVINNLPADVMRGLRRGPVIGVDVGSQATLKPPGSGPRPVSLSRWLAKNLGSGRGRPAMPNIFQTLWHAGTAGSSALTPLLRNQIDLLLQPPLTSVDMLDWKAVDRVVEIGYRHTVAQLERVRESREMSQLFFLG